jgi:hypothetical protein
MNVVSALQTSGFTVWSDRYIEGGALFALEIERELSSALCLCHRPLVIRVRQVRVGS